MRIKKTAPDIKAIVISEYDDPVMKNYADYGFQGALEKTFPLRGCQEGIGRNPDMKVDILHIAARQVHEVRHRFTNSVARPNKSYQTFNAES